MSRGEVTDKTAAPRRERIRVRVDKLRLSRQRSAVGIAELAELAGSAVMLLAVVFAYLSFYSPARSRLAKAQIERASLQQKLSDAQKKLDANGSTQDSVSRIVESLDSFENGHLAGRDEGRLTLYNTLIQLIKSNGLRNTSGPAYTYLEAKNENRNQGPKLGNTKWQSLYPGIAVTVTVEEQYANLRHFVRDIESSRQFIIINAVELERASDADTLGTMPGAQPRSTLVSLKVDMAAYYRRTGSSEVTEQPASQAR